PLAGEEIVISGLSGGIPGPDDPFSPRALDALMAGKDRIEPLPLETRQAIVAFGLERIEKDADGRIQTVRITHPDETIHFSGRFPPSIDLSRHGLSGRIAAELDETTRLAVAAGFEAIANAGLPLIPREEGFRYYGRYRLPPSVGARMGIVFASAFAGAEHWLHAAHAHQRGEGFDRHFLIQCLGMGQSTLARFLGITGPTFRLQAACASTLSAIAVAEDWIATGRADRVLVVAADAAGSPTLLPYIGAGFLAVGGVSTEREIERAAQPFGKGRAGTIIGSGAVGLVLERAASALGRGVRPRARLLGTALSNDACHPTKMNPEAIAASMKRLIDRVAEAHTLDRRTLAGRAFFVSHEPFTPARGGSADAEAHTLRTCFGEALQEVPVVNVKGYTGHPMGASLEEVVAVEALERGWLPPVRNREAQDPALSDLTLSEGRRTQAHYAIRLAAGFGAQIACAVYGKVPGEGPRFDRETLEGWLAAETEGHYRDLDASGRYAVAAGKTLTAGTPPAQRELPDASQETRSSLEIVIPAWRWRPLEGGGSAREVDRDARIAAPLRSDILGPEDLLDLVSAWLDTLREDPPDFLLLPPDAAAPWQRAAAEAIAGATRAYRRETEGRVPCILWSEESPDPRHLPRGMAECRLARDERGKFRIAERIWLPLPLPSPQPVRGNWLLLGGGRG
ncbi:MAG: hypothetical protein D6795_01080, partial [Deltaproteobacteria bacterium]